MRANSLAIAAIFLAGCASNQPITIDEPPPPVVCTQTPRVDLLDLQDTPPAVVLNTENNVWGYWFDPAGYAALAENLQAMRMNARQQRAVSRYYRACIEDHNAALAAEEATP